MKESSSNYAETIQLPGVFVNCEGLKHFFQLERAETTVNSDRFWTSEKAFGDRIL